MRVGSMSGVGGVLVGFAGVALSTALSCNGAVVGRTRASTAHDGGDAEAEALVDGGPRAPVPAPGAVMGCACPHVPGASRKSCCLPDGGCGVDVGGSCIRAACGPLDPPFECKTTSLPLDQLCFDIYISQPGRMCTGPLSTFSRACLTSTCCKELTACMNDPGCRSAVECDAAQCDATKDCEFPNYYPCARCPQDQNTWDIQQALVGCALDHCAVW